MQDILKNMTRDRRIRFANDLADFLINDDFGIIAEDFFECYRLEMTSFLEKTDEQIIKACKFKFDFKTEFSQFFYEAEPKIKSFSEAIKPLDKMAIAIRLVNNTSCKSEELKILKARGAEIYIVVGNAMTWANRADLAFDCFKKALPYAEASGDAELISLARKKVDEWQKINKQIAANSKEDSSDFFWIVVIGIIFFLLTR